MVVIFGSADFVPVVAASEIASVGLGYCPAEISASYAVVVTAAGKDTVVVYFEIAVVGEQLVAYLASASEYWQKYWETPLAPMSSQLSSAKSQRRSECSANWNSGQPHLAW